MKPSCSSTELFDFRGYEPPVTSINRDPFENQDTVGWVGNRIFVDSNLRSQKAGHEIALTVPCGDDDASPRFPVKICREGIDSVNGRFHSNFVLWCFFYTFSWI